MSMKVQSRVRATPTAAPKQPGHPWATVRVSLSWFGIHRASNDGERIQTAQLFGADYRSLNFTKRLLDPTHPALRVTQAMKRRILGYWRGMSLPLPGFADVRLIRQDDMDAFVVQMAGLKEEFEEAIENLEVCYGELQELAKLQLGGLYQAGDYPRSLQSRFDVSWDWPRVQVPGYLQGLPPGPFGGEPAPPASLSDTDVEW
jgi:hypothetical protein